MTYRNFQQMSTGKWLDVVFKSENGFDVTQESHGADIAKGWGIAEADLSVVDGDSDARTGTLVAGPTPVDGLLEWRTHAAVLLNNTTVIADQAQRDAMAFLIGAKALTIPAGQAATEADVKPR